MNQSLQSGPRQDKQIYQRPSTPLKVHVLPQEKLIIQERADMCHISVSMYLKTLGLGNIPKSKLDAKAILSLLQVNGDQGRLGGLLKLLLTEQGDHLGGKAHRDEINKLLDDLAEVQKQLMVIVRLIKLQ